MVATLRNDVSFSGEAAHHAPLPFELIQLGDEPKDFRSDAQKTGQHGCLG